MIGFLNPKGELLECSSWEHLDKAVELCEQLFGIDFYVRQDAEDYLLSLGYMAIRARDVYMSYKNDDTGKWIVLTDEQLKWLAENVNSFNDGQKKDINEILFDQEDIRKRN